MLPDLSDDSPGLKSDQAVALAELQAQYLACVVAAHRRLLVIERSADADRPLDDTPYLAASVVVLPGQPLSWGDQEQLGAERQLLAGVLQARVREVGMGEVPDVGLGDQQEPAPGTGQILTDDGQPSGG